MRSARLNLKSVLSVMLALVVVFAYMPFALGNQGIAYGAEAITIEITDDADSVNQQIRDAGLDSWMSYECNDNGSSNFKQFVVKMNGGTGGVLKPEVNIVNNLSCNDVSSFLIFKVSGSVTVGSISTKEGVSKPAHMRIEGQDKERDYLCCDSITYETSQKIQDNSAVVTFPLEFMYVTVNAEKIKGEAAAGTSGDYWFADPDFTICMEKADVVTKVFEACSGVTVFRTTIPPYGSDHTRDCTRFGNFTAAQVNYGRILRVNAGYFTAEKATSNLENSYFVIDGGTVEIKNKLDARKLYVIRGEGTIEGNLAGIGNIEYINSTDEMSKIQTNGTSFLDVPVYNGTSKKHSIQVLDKDKTQCQGTDFKPAYKDLKEGKLVFGTPYKITLIKPDEAKVDTDSILFKNITTDDFPRDEQGKKVPLTAYVANHTPLMVKGKLVPGYMVSGIKIGGKKVPCDFMFHSYDIDHDSGKEEYEFTLIADPGEITGDATMELIIEESDFVKVAYNISLMSVQITEWELVHKGGTLKGVSEDDEIYKVTGMGKDDLGLYEDPEGKKPYDMTKAVNKDMNLYYIMPARIIKGNLDIVQPEICKGIKADNLDSVLYEGGYDTQFNSAGNVVAKLEERYYGVADAAITDDKLKASDITLVKIKDENKKTLLNDPTKRYFALYSCASAMGTELDPSFKVRCGSLTLPVIDFQDGSGSGKCYWCPIKVKDCDLIKCAAKEGKEQYWYCPVCKGCYFNQGKDLETVRQIVREATRALSDDLTEDENGVKTLKLEEDVCYFEDNSGTDVPEDDIEIDLNGHRLCMVNGMETNGNITVKNGRFISNANIAGAKLILEDVDYRSDVNLDVKELELKGKTNWVLYDDTLPFPNVEEWKLSIKDSAKIRLYLAGEAAYIKMASTKLSSMQAYGDANFVEQIKPYLPRGARIVDAYDLVGTALAGKKGEEFMVLGSGKCLELAVQSGGSGGKHSGGKGTSESAGGADAAAGVTEKGEAKVENSSTKDGSKVESHIDEKGQTTKTVVELSENAVKDAKATGGAVVLPKVDKMGKNMELQIKYPETSGNSGKSGLERAMIVKQPILNMSLGLVPCTVDASGKETPIVLSSVDKDGVTFGVTGDSTVRLVEKSISFSDVKSGDWFAPYANWAGIRDVMEGIGGNSFAPYSGTTKAMMLQIMENYSEASGIELKPVAETSQEAFKDVKAGSWYEKCAVWGKALGIAQGDGGKLDPNKLMKRQECAVLLVNMMKAMGLDLSTVPAVTYADRDKVAPWARESMDILVGLGILGGTSSEEGNIVADPEGNTNRAQISAVMERLNQYILTGQAVK